MFMVFTSSVILSHLNNIVLIEHAVTPPVSSLQHFYKSSHSCASTVPLQYPVQRRQSTLSIRRDFLYKKRHPSGQESSLLK